LGFDCSPVLNQWQHTNSRLPTYLDVGTI
jgi:hypothetical protein